MQGRLPSSKKSSKAGSSASGALSSGSTAALSRGKRVYWPGKAPIDREHLDAAFIEDSHLHQEHEHDLNGDDDDDDDDDDNLIARLSSARSKSQAPFETHSSPDLPQPSSIPPTETSPPPSSIIINREPTDEQVPQVKETIRTRERRKLPASNQDAGDIGQIPAKETRPVALKPITNRIRPGDDKDDDDARQNQIKAISDEGEQVESEEESDQGEEEEEELEEFEPRVPLMKPVFVPASDRVTIEEQRQREKEEEERKNREKLRQEEKKRESKRLVIDTLRKEAEQENNGGKANLDDAVEMPPDDDNVDAEAEYEAWKIRELRRIKREQEEKQERESELAEIERRRNLTDEERAREDREWAKKHPQGERSKWNYLQRYYHKGAYFMEYDKEGQLKEQLYRRDYGEATLEDKVDKSILPRVLQVKKFGLRGRTKWTHLSNEDTSIRDREHNPWHFSSKDPVVKRKMAGMSSDFDKPSTSSSSKRQRRSSSPTSAAAASSSSRSPIADNREEHR